MKTETKIKSVQEYQVTYGLGIENRGHKGRGHKGRGHKDRGHKGRGQKD